MKTKLFAIALAAGVGAWGLSTVFPSEADAMPVYDSANYAQNLVQAARALEQINHQLSSLQNEAAMLRNMDKHLKGIGFEELNALTGKLQSIDKLMGKAEGIGFKVDELERQYETLFPKDWKGRTRDSRIADARGRVDAALAAFKQSMTVQSQVIENVAADAAALKAIAGKSQGAEGSLAATQATNQLLALAAKQQLQLQSLLAAQFRSQAVDDASRIRSGEEGRQATAKFLGTGRAYHIPK